MEKKEKLVLIDGNSLINRAFYALPLLSNDEGEFSNAVYGFCNILLKLIETEEPKYIAVAFDIGYPTFRHNLYAEYKAGRKKMPDELASQLPILKSVLTAMNIKYIEQKGIEADDIVGTLSKKFNTQTIIVSGDRDLFQLVDNTTTVWFTKKGISNALHVTPENIHDVYGVNANQVVDLKALMGDSSDNIKGVDGIGEVTAKKLINTYSSLNGIFENINEIKGKIKEKLISGKQDALLSQTLATINTSVPLNIKLEDLEYVFPFNQKVYNIFQKYNFTTLLKRSELFENNQTNINKITVKINHIQTTKSLTDAINSILQAPKMSLFLDENEFHFTNTKFEENIIQFNNNQNGNEFTEENAFLILRSILENAKINKIVLNSKNIKHLLTKYNINLSGVEFDSNLALYLLSGSKKTDYSKVSFSEKFNFNENCIAACLYSTEDELMKCLSDEGMTKLYYDIELPLVDVLFKMEQNGFKIDQKILNELGVSYEQELNSLTKIIYTEADEEFNINSPKQLGTILFDKLGLKVSKNKKNSTSVEVLEKLKGIHPIIESLLRYRKIEKFYSTYIAPFEKLVDKETGLIHTIFNQTLTATGRLSSSEPNLQNIPVRDEEGKALRKMFIPREAGGKIITSDYSQIELRLLAHYSNDSRLQYAYHNNIDIHKQTASDVYGVQIIEVTPEMRRNAKMVNFGIIYGISEYGLSQDLCITREQAKELITKYFKTYSSVKEYMESSVKKAKEMGYVSTMLGRKRKIDELKSDNYMTRQFGERAAMNMPLQGTASDIIKIAMINVSKALSENHLKSKLILQIHDELIIDCANGEEEIVKKILKDNMENAVKLSVPLTVDVESGDNWFLAK